jgi:predicted DNA-binding WGR domain protein
MKPVRLEKRVLEKNQFRFHRLALQPTLFGEWSVVREWGRIGRQGRVVVDTFTEAAFTFNRKAAQKGRRR